MESIALYFCFGLKISTTSSSASATWTFQRRNAWGCWRLSAFVPELSSSFSACAGGIRPVEGMVEGWPDGKKIQDLEVDRQQKVPGDVQDKDTSGFGRKDDERETKKILPYYTITYIYCTCLPWHFVHSRHNKFFWYRSSSVVHRISVFCHWILWRNPSLSIFSEHPCMAYIYLHLP